MKKLPLYAPLFLRIIFAIYLYLSLNAGVYTSTALQQYGENLTKLGLPMGHILAYISTFSMLICYTLLVIGWKTKWAAIPVMINFTVAIIYGHVIPDHTISKALPATVLLVLAIFFLMNGPGKPSVDEGL
jgi:putative oxidoreductase